MPARADLAPPKQNGAGAASVAQPAPSAEAPNPDIAKRCGEVAKQRAEDGVFIGLSEEMQQQEYDGTFARCMAFKNAHKL